MDDSEFGVMISDLGGNPAQKYYVVGPVAAGKTTVLGDLRCFTTFEEWTGRVPREMYLNHRKLNDAERERVNVFLCEQLVEKNGRLQAGKIGYYVMDRAPLDLFAFSKSNSENLDKIDMLRKRVMSSGDFERGEVIYLDASNEALETRMMKRGKVNIGARLFYTGSALRKQGEILKGIYGPAQIFDTSNQPSGETAREIARAILLGEYRPFDFTKRIEEIKAAGGKVR